MAINFRFDTRKAAEVICWLANEQPGIDLYQIMKAVYFADKEHLLRYGRPVVGDRYYAMEHGMAPSIIYAALAKDDRYGSDFRELLDESVEEREEEYPSYYPKREPDERLLSGSDIRCLRAALARCADLSFDELKRLAHDEPAYREAWENRPEHAERARMRYESIIDGENREELLEYLRETAPYLVP